MSSQVGKHGCLVREGSLDRVSLLYGKRRQLSGLFSSCDCLALDKIQSINFTDEDDEIRGTLKGYLESGECRIAEYEGLGEVGLVLLGNTDEVDMSENASMLLKLPDVL